MVGLAVVPLLSQAELGYGPSCALLQRHLVSGFRAVSRQFATGSLRPLHPEFPVRRDHLWVLLGLQMPWSYL